MSEQTSVNIEQSTVSDEGPETVQAEKLVPVGEAIRYRKRAQAAEKELSELKQTHEQQADELSVLKEKVQQLEEAAEQSAADSVKDTHHKTQGVKESRTGGARTLLQNAARQAADTGSRADVQEYLRLRRNFV